ncbi:MlaE family lipid ABC transporter permease subunit [Wenzhouxiangella sp. EGI_FJ10305]|uniref:MlaE family lipid ABC transporter permease subunit n=1 Tax=Wenzhouxiangella sp. EGI_FJ10305 TaxID=3243768 RepID=UPI0035D9D568
MSEAASRTALTAPVREAGRAVLFLLTVFSRMRFGRRQFGEILRQVYFAGVRSLVIIVISGFFVGLVLTLQTYDTLTRFGAADAVSTVLALSLFRELGPVLAALLFAGRAGTSITAEIGLMRATEQLDALDLMAIDPMERIVQPRLIAGLIALPALVLIFNVTAIVGGVFFAVFLMGSDPITFWSNMQSSVELVRDFGGGLLKAVFFGFVAAWLAVWFGWSAKPTSEGVALATTQTVIATAIAVLILDFILSAFML